jgi:hypothetical protein
MEYSSSYSYDIAESSVFAGYVGVEVDIIEKYFLQYRVPAHSFC